MEENNIYNEVNGEYGKKDILSVLNKKKVTRYEMDEVMNCEV